MGRFDTDGLVRLVVIGMIVCLIGLGVFLGFSLASVINLGKMCL